MKKTKKTAPKKEAINPDPIHVSTERLYGIWELKKNDVIAACAVDSDSNGNVDAKMVIAILPGVFVDTKMPVFHKSVVEPLCKHFATVAEEHGHLNIKWDNISVTIN